MKRKFLSLLPLVAIAAVVLIPATAQAEPHFYKNNTILPEEKGELFSEGTPVISWSKLTLETKTIGTIVCSNAFGATVYNPLGGGPGESKVQSYAVWNCTNESCEVGFKSKMEIVPEGLNKFGYWETKLIEPEAGVIRLKSGNTTLNSPHQIQFLIACPPNGLGEIKTPSRGELTPKTKNGTALSAPSKVEFGAGSGELELAGVSEGKVVGSLKIMGYAGNEIITTKNP